MLINSDINVLGSLPDFNLINYFLFEKESGNKQKIDHHSFTSIKTEKSVNRFEKAIMGTFLKFSHKELEVLLCSILKAESISPDSLIMLFWNSSINNNILAYLNDQVYFPAFYSGRLILKKDEISACLKDLREREQIMQNWTNITLETVASKYLTLLKKFNLLAGSVNKKIRHPYLNDKMFVLFVYWLVRVENKANLLESVWIKYSFCETPGFIERILQKKYSKVIQLTYTGDKLKIETSIPYENIYDAVK